MSDEREFLECEIADAMESDEDVRPEVAAIIEARSERDLTRAQLAQREGEIEALRAEVTRLTSEKDALATMLDVMKSEQMHADRYESERERENDVYM